MPREMRCPSWWDTRLADSDEEVRPCKVRGRTSQVRGREASMENLDGEEEERKAQLETLAA